MKTEFLKSLIPETVEGRDDIIAKIFAENGKDINALKTENERLSKELTAANETVAGLKESAGDAEKLKQKIADYETKEAERAENEKKTAKQREVAQRFATAKGQHEFLDPDIEDAVMNKFMAALDDAANKGKGDAEIYAALTKDKPFFKSMNPDVNMGGVGDVSKMGTITPEQFKAMGMRERSELAAKDPKQYELLSKRR